MSDELTRALAERDNYRRALHAALAAVSEHNVPKLDTHTMLIGRGAVAIMREVLRGGTLSNTGILRSRGAAPPERDADSPLLVAAREWEESQRLYVGMFEASEHEGAIAAAEHRLSRAEDALRAALEANDAPQ